MKKYQKQLIGLGCFLVAFFFFFAPGWMFGGINYIRPDSQVRVLETVFIRKPIPGTTTTGFDIYQNIAHDLNPYQVAELSSLLRRSWFRRTIRQSDWVFTTFPDHVQNYSDFVIVIRDGVNHQITLDITWGMWIRRGGTYNDRLRIHNPNWDNEILRILEVSTYEE